MVMGRLIVTIDWYPKIPEKHAVSKTYGSALYPPVFGGNNNYGKKEK